MQFSKLFDDDRAVSPVIGVILMVAITVILAAVIGTFVLGLGDNVSTTPQAQFGFQTGGSSADLDPASDSDGSFVTITHESGDTIAASNLEISEDGNSVELTSASAFGSSDDVNAGTTVVVDAASGDTLRVIYDNPDNDKTATLAKKTV